jgi:CO/xanthine dehydrogenase Mo-binding subunit
MDMGQGLSVALRQIVAEELDIAYSAVKLVIGDTDRSLNQGGASGSTGVQLGGKQLRMAAAEARRVLLDLAAAKLGVPAEQLSVNGGVIHSDAEMAKSVSYGELIGGHYFNVGPVIGSMRPAWQNRRSRKLIKSLASQSCATTSRQRCSLRKTFARTSERRAWCTAG